MLFAGCLLVDAGDKRRKELVSFLLDYGLYLALGIKLLQTGYCPLIMIVEPNALWMYKFGLINSLH